MLKYEYQGQEHQTELGLNWSSFKYRNYDYDIGRFMSVDPLAEKFPYMTVYQFAGNKPSWSVEIEGLESAVDLKMRLKEAENNAPKLDMSVDEYLKKTSPSFSFHIEYVPLRDSNGNVIIDNNYDAIKHYYRGNGETVVLGSKTVNLIKSNKDVQKYISNITSGKTPKPASPDGKLRVDMEAFNRGFHLGQMTFDYKTKCYGKMCITNIIVDDDGFVDPNSILPYFETKNKDDGLGPNHELGGVPYDYKPVTWSIIFENPGYKVDENNNPLPINNDENENQ